MVCAHWISSPKYTEASGDGKDFTPHAGVSGSQKKRRRSTSKLAMLVNRFLIRGALLTAVIALLLDTLAAWRREESGYPEGLSEEGKSCVVSSVFQSRDNWSATLPIHNTCWKLDWTRWFSLNPKNSQPGLKASLGYKRYGNSLDHSEYSSRETHRGSGLALRATWRQQEVPVLATIIQDITGLCYQLEARLLVVNGRSPGPSTSLATVKSYRSEYDVLLLISELQQCVSRLRKSSVRPVVSAPWRQRFQPLQTFAEHFVPNTEVEGHVSMESVQEGETTELLNFAEAANGAKVLAANPEAKKPHKAIDGKADTFLFNECKASGGMWMMLELSDVAKVKVVELVMRELYSSRIAMFTVFGRLPGLGKDVGEYPRAFYSKQWQSLGNFTTKDIKGAQQFSVDHGAWIKYVGLHFLSYHGLERACTINEIRVFGVAQGNDLQVFDVPVENKEVWQQSPERNIGDADESMKVTDGLNLGSIEDSEALMDKEVVEATVKTDPNDTEVRNLGEDEKNVSSALSVEDAPSSKPNIEMMDGAEPLDTASTIQDKSVKAPVTEEAEIDVQTPSEELVSAGEPPAVSAYKRMRQELQMLKRNTSMLGTYVDTMRSGLMDTIDELWMAISKMENRTAALSKDLVQVSASNKIMQERLEAIEAAAAYNSQVQVKVLLGTVGLCFGMGGLVLAWKYHGRYTLILIVALSVANIAIGLLNLLVSCRPVNFAQLHSRG